MNQTRYPLTRLISADIAQKVGCRLLLMPVLSALMFPSLLSAQINSALCPVSLEIPPRPRVAVSLDPGDIFLTADDAESTEGGLSILTGNAEMVHNNQHVSADRITHDQSLDIANLEGTVNYWDNDVYMNSSSAHIELESDTGFFPDVSYWLLANRGRGNAREVHVTAGSRTVGKRVDFTTCDPDLDSPWNLTTNIWKITARELTLNHETDRGTGKHVVLKLKDIPVFYTPYLSFPMGDQRKSGFLFPAFGSSNRYGIELETPYYWNIAPHMDATISPRLLSNSGVMLSGEYRYLFRRGEGILNLEYLPNDKSFEDEDRGSIAFEHRQAFLNAGRLVMKYNRVSDQEYFEDFGDSLLRTSTRYLEQSAIASYRWNLAGHRLNLYNTIDNYQIIDQSIRITSRPYRRLPSTTLTYTSPYGSGQFNYDITTKLDYFTRGEDPQLNNVNGFRYDLFPSISFPIQNIAYNLTPRAGLRFTQYHLEENNRFDDDAPNRVLPYFSLDGTVFLERTTRLFGRDILQTLEPRLYYLYVPEKDQSDLPVFDTRQYGTTYASLFYQDRFNGPDRVGDTNQATFAVTSRIYSDITGRQLAHFSLGQTYYLKDRTVVLPGRQIQEDRVSALISEFGTTWFDDLYIRGEVQWDPNINFIQKVSLNTQYQPAQGKVLNMGYRVNRTSPDARVTNLLRVEQADVSFSWPLKDSWNLVGRWNYAIEESRTLDTFAGVEYNSCCWGFRAVARRFLSNLDGDFEMGIFLQFELKGLAGLGRKTVDFLTMSIPGYRYDF